MKYDFTIKDVYGSSSLRMLLEIMDSWEYITDFDKKLAILKVVREQRVYPNREKTAPEKKE